MTKKVLAVGAHPDDEVLGPGGTLAKHADSGDEVHALIITEGTTTQYDDDELIEKKKRAAERCADRLGVSEVHYGDLPDMKLDSVQHVEVNDVIERLVDSVEPDIVYTHSPHEVNKDHKAVYESTVVATRPASGVEQVYTYETPSSTEWKGGDVERFSPNRYVDISGYLDTKIEAFKEYRMEERDYPHPRSERALRSLAETRGVAAGFTVAEAFSVVTSRVTQV